MRSHCTMSYQHRFVLQTIGCGKLYMQAMNTTRHSILQSDDNAKLTRSRIHDQEKVTHLVENWTLCRLVMLTVRISKL